LRRHVSVPRPSDPEPGRHRLSVRSSPIKERRWIVAVAKFQSPSNLSASMS